MEISNLIKMQRMFYFTNETLDISFRRKQLKKLKETIKFYEDDLKEALLLDLGKSGAESYLTEIGITLKEISFMEKHLKKLMKNRRVGTSIKDFPAKSYISPHPYGVVLVMSPWNYPVMLSFCPLIGAIAAGNTCVLKPSEYSIYTTKVIDKIIKESFDSNYVACVTGGISVSQEILNQKYDYIFYTGGKVVGRIVMEKAAKHLTAISLELGGKSPCIVDETANIKIAAKRIAFGKYLNAGQTCVAPDYLYIHESIKDEFLEQFELAINELFTSKPFESENYGKIINQRHFDRLSELLKDQFVLIGGTIDSKSLKISPTVLGEITATNKIMEEEIFGPILPLLTYSNIDDVINYINQNPSPLALYLFTSKKQIENKVLKSCNFGGGCINDTVMHVASETLPFGGVGESGMGNYHGRASFETFSHYRSIMRKETWLDLPIRYAPYTKIKNKIVKLFLR
ncbi:MAG: aldehyde dehydrogenase [Tenericutes bacterium]|nr:aldehyde dehydrogenase [Mycoplasmatota bacterium]